MMMKKALFLLSFCFLNLSSQIKLTEKQIDSTFNSLYTSQTNDLTYLEPALIEMYYKSREIDYPKGKLESLLRLSAFYINLNKNSEKVKSNLDEAEKLSLEEDDYFYLCKVKALQSSMFAYRFLFQKSLLTLKQGLEIINKVQDIEQKKYLKAYYYARFINLYVLQNKQDSVFFYAKAMYNTSLQLPDKNLQKANFIAISSRVLTDFYTDKQQFREAELYLKQQEKYLKKPNNLFDFGMYHKTKAKLILSNNLFQQNRQDSALHHFLEAERNFQISKNNLVQAHLFSEISKLYREKGDDKKSLTYATESKNINIFFERNPKASNSQIINANQIIPDFDQEFIVEDVGAAPIVIVKNSFYVITLLLVTLLTALFWMRKRYFKLILPKSNLKHTRPKNIKINSNKIGELTSQALSRDKAFFINFVNEFPDFGDKLIKINSSIKVSDVEFCAFLRLNLDTKQIAEIKKMSIAAVAAKKSRIRKKLNIDTQENLYNWLFKL